MKSNQYLIAGNLTTGQFISAQKLLQEGECSYAKYSKAFFPAVIWIPLLLINSPSIFFFLQTLSFEESLHVFLIALELLKMIILSL